MLFWNQPETLFLQDWQATGLLTVIVGIQTIITPPAGLLPASALSKSAGSAILLQVLYFQHQAGHPLLNHQDFFA